MPPPAFRLSATRTGGQKGASSVEIASITVDDGQLQAAAERTIQQYRSRPSLSLFSHGLLLQPSGSTVPNKPLINACSQGAPPALVDQSPLPVNSSSLDGPVSP
ncbi:hypothetical protein M9H77_29673 [Catharanthus roseus]|uniref:Uncharacterized protein n=1 Tax=Catharanthus roseus TaxID=4058 RepID=A0ACB9ZYY2_CATRO|nr:hypothetical protein M9H77_29673 [Catharanthus roseus]